MTALWVLATGSGWPSEPSDHDQVRADFVIRMFDFVEWPAELTLSDSVATIVTVGESPVVAALERRSGRRIAGRRLEVARSADAGNLPPCHIVYVAQAHLEAAVIQNLRAQPVLTVGESPSFLSAGGIMRFFVEDGQVRFELSPVAAERAGVRLSSQILALARVEPREAEP